MNKQILQMVTEEILNEVRTLISVARHASLAVSEIESGRPAISRVALATKPNGIPILLTSALTPHTAALAANAHCSLLVGEVGKGDPMAHPRATVFCQAKTAPNQNRGELREIFLAHHPKAKNYIDLPDFGFWELDIERVSYNAGFGKAYAIAGLQLIQQN